MKILELIEGGEDKAFGIIGLKDGKLFVKGLEEKYYLSWLGDGVDDKEGVLKKPVDGDEFLEAVKDKLESGEGGDEIMVRGPIEVSELPDLEEVKEEGREEVPEYSDLKEGGE